MTRAPAMALLLRMQALEALATLLGARLRRSSAAAPLRVWVPGCARGEEVWSLAICLWEGCEAVRAEPHIQLFASDPDEEAVSAVRRGLCPPDIARHLSARRLARFFERQAGGYRVCAALRRAALAGPHDALLDPPLLSGLDVIDCRGLAAQIETAERDAARLSRLYRRLHFALREGGWLVLARPLPGARLDSLFESASIDWPIYRARPRQEPLERPDEPGGSIAAHRRAARLERRLCAADRRIASLSAQLEAANEALRAAHGRLRSRSEELAVRGLELAHRARSLDAADSDLANLVDAADVVAVFLDCDLRVRRFTASAARLLALGSGNLGRPLRQIGARFLDSALERQVRQVIDTAGPTERTVSAGEHRWYLRRIRPHLAGGRVAGEVIVWIDITQSKALQQEISTVAAAEQQRIGQELHDGIQQDLAGLGLLAQTLRDLLGAHAGAPRDLAERLAQSIAAMNERLHALARGLVTVPIDAQSLVPALAELARSTRETFRVDCQFEPDRVRIPDADTATHLYRIAQEAVRNAVRHSGADRITIRLAAPGGEVALTVIDNGIGLPPPGPPHRGVGLRLMAHRSSLIGGRFVAESPPEGGTRIACILPEQADVPEP